MKTYQITLPDDTAALVEKMLQDGPWESIDELFMNGIGTLQEDVVTEAEIGLDYEEVKRKLLDAQDDSDAVLAGEGDEVFQALLAKIGGNPTVRTG